MDDGQIHEVVRILTEAVKNWQTPAVTIVSLRDGDPFKVLVACILSLRTQDRTTDQASRRLFELAPDPQHLADLPINVIENAIYPVGFFRNKARVLRDIAHILLDRYDGRVPDDLEELLTLKGVGRKTANLVITLGFGKQGICVDTHVHRIFNRLGYIRTVSPEETETALRQKLPAEYWIVINDLLVTFGQNQCKPVSPKCSSCPLDYLCPRIGVSASR